MADGDLYKPTVGTTVSTTTWQISSNDGGSWVNAPSNTPPNTTNDVFLNGISLTVDANLSFKTLRNTTTYNKNQTAVSMQSVSNLTAGGKLILTGSYTLTGSATAHGDLALDGNNCISGGAANALIDNTGQVGAQTTTLNNVRVKAGTAATHHGFNVVTTAAMIFNCSNNCRFQGAVSTAACHGFNSAVNSANITFSGDIEFKGGDVASSYGLNVSSNATIKINNTSTTQVKMTGGTQSGCFGVSLTAGGSTITIGDIATGDLNYLITAGSGATCYGLYIINLTTTANINIGVPSTSANTTNVVVSSSTSPAIYCSITVAPIVIYRGTLKTTSNGWQPIVTLSKLFILGSNAVLVEFPTATGSASFTTNASVSNVTEASIWGYLTTNAEFSTTNAVAKLIKDNLNASVGSRMATFSLPTNFSNLSIQSTGQVGLDFTSIYQATSATTLNNITIPTVTTVNGLGSNVITTASINNGAITAAKFGTGAIDSNVFDQTAADRVWATTIRNVTSATNITSDGLTIDQTKIAKLDDTITSRAAASTALDNTIWTNTKAGYLDSAISSRLASASYTAPDNTSITAIKAKTDNLPSDPASNTQVNTRLASSSYTAPDNTTISTINTNVSAIKTKTDNLPANTTTELTTIQTNTTDIPNLVAQVVGNIVANLT